jgi:signal transduction histidine kinase
LGKLCAIDPKPAALKNTLVITMFRMFADLIGMHLETNKRLTFAETSLVDARVASELREQFVAVLGHDLRNPLAAITAGTRILRNEPLSIRGKTIVRMMENSTTRMVDLIESMTGSRTRKAWRGHPNRAVECAAYSRPTASG